MHYNIFQTISMKYALNREWNKRGWQWPEYEMVSRLSGFDGV